jgi:ammonium transporter Rh
MEVIIVILFIVFARIETDTQITADPLWSQRYSAFQDVNVMIVVGFGFLMTFIRTHSWSALAYTFFINGIIVQTYILLKAFWQRIFNGFAAEGFYIKISQVLITESSYATASALIAFGVIIGRAGPR